MTLQQPIAEAKKGNRSAEQLLYERFAARATILCYRYLRNLLDAEEAAHDGFCKFFTSLKNFSYVSDPGVYAYIKIIMIRVCIRRVHRKEGARIISIEDIPDISTDDDLYKKIERAELLKLIVKLPVKEATILNLSFIDGYKHKEIALLLNITETASRTRLLRAKNLMNELVTKTHNEYGKQYRYGK